MHICAVLANILNAHLYSYRNMFFQSSPMHQQINNIESQITSVDEVNQLNLQSICFENTIIQKLFSSSSEQVHLFTFSTRVFPITLLSNEH